MGLIKIPSTRNTSKYKQVLEYEYKFIENLFNWKDEEDKSQFLYDCAREMFHYWFPEEVN